MTSSPDSFTVSLFLASSTRASVSVLSCANGPTPGQPPDLIKSLEVSALNLQRGCVGPSIFATEESASAVEFDAALELLLEDDVDRSASVKFDETGAVGEFAGEDQTEPDESDFAFDEPSVALAPDDAFDFEPLYFSRLVPAVTGLDSAEPDSLSNGVFASAPDEAGVGEEALLVSLAGFSSI